MIFLYCLESRRILIKNLGNDTNEKQTHIFGHKSIIKANKEFLLLASCTMAGHREEYRQGSQREYKNCSVSFLVFLARATQITGLPLSFSICHAWLFLLGMGSGVFLRMLKNVHLLEKKNLLGYAARWRREK